jgi:hypothetical protein
MVAWHKQLLEAGSVLRRKGSGNQAVAPDRVEAIQAVLANPFAVPVVNCIFHGLPYMMLCTKDCSAEPTKFSWYRS